VADLPSLTSYGRWRVYLTCAAGSRLGGTPLRFSQHPRRRNGADDLRERLLARCFSWHGSNGLRGSWGHAWSTPRDTQLPCQREQNQNRTVSNHPQAPLWTEAAIRSASPLPLRYRGRAASDRTLRVFPGMRGGRTARRRAPARPAARAAVRSHGAI